VGNWVKVREFPENKKLRHSISDPGRRGTEETSHAKGWTYQDRKLGLHFPHERKRGKGEALEILLQQSLSKTTLGLCPNRGGEEKKARGQDPTHESCFLYQETTGGSCTSPSDSPVSHASVEPSVPRKRSVRGDEGGSE